VNGVPQPGQNLFSGFVDLPHAVHTFWVRCGVEGDIFEEAEASFALNMK
jgi:hypothetical protein